MAFKPYLTGALILADIAWPNTLKTDLLYRKSYTKSRKKGHASYTGMSFLRTSYYISCHREITRSVLAQGGVNITSLFAKILERSRAQFRLPGAMTRTVLCFKNPEIGIIFFRLGYFPVRKPHRKGHLYSNRPGTVFILIAPFQDYQGRCYCKGVTLQDPGIVYCLENFSVRRSREFGTTGCARY